ncbi:Hemin transport system permease protein HmuU [Planctomycetes bacterium Poly30]|uniref:Hemin transport system permease protein HmuU n=1 Tax=Saltatorellus ferox TaxID=2528018 RepID=A0A518EZ30_9BACT|nr:Hemin transport system permease protein HmuU [Planctomycetes bacterium Poly30]
MSDGKSSAAVRPRRTWQIALFLGAVVLLLVIMRVQVGTAEGFSLSFHSALSAIGGYFGFGAGLDAAPQLIASGRLLDAVTAALVGAALGLSGALFQGLFRNELASPGLIGVTSGAALGAMIGILIIGGMADGFAGDGLGVMPAAMKNGPLVVTSFSFAGALGCALFVALLATRGGRISVPTLLLVGVAINACLGGVLAAAQDYLLREEWHLAQALFSWLFGSLTDSTPQRIGVVAGGLAVALLAVPLVAHELDLFASGEETAQSLGVATLRTKLIVLCAASVAAAAAVSVAGQIAFVGLVVPHVLRLTTGTRHGSLLPLSALGGAVFLLGAETLNVSLLGGQALRPGIVLSLIGGPFFLVLLLRRSREVSSW